MTCLVRMMFKKAETNSASRDYKITGLADQVFQKESSFRSSSKLSCLAVMSFSLAGIPLNCRFSLGFVRGLRLTCIVDVEAESFLFFTVWMNPLGVCRKCRFRLWSCFLEAERVLVFSAVLLLFCSAEYEQG